MALFTYPPVSLSIPAVGTTGLSAPTSALEVAGVNPSGNLTALSLDASANLYVNIASSVLPTGAATAAGLTTINTTLGTPFQAGGSIGNTAFGISGTLPAFAATPTVNLGTLNGAATAANQSTMITALNNLDAGTPAALGQTTMSASMPVVIASNQSAVPVSGTVTANISGSISNTSFAATQSTASNLLAQVSQPTASNLNATVVQGTAANLLTQVSQPTASSLNMTDATGVLAQGSVAAGTAASKSVLTGLVYNSTPVSLTNGQQVAKQADVNGNLQTVQQDLMFTGQSAQTALINNIIPATAGSAATNAQGFHSASIQINSTGTGGAYIIEGSNDNSNFVSIPVWNQLILTGTPITAAVTASATNIVYTFPITTQYIRVRISTAITGGSIQAFTKLMQAPFAPPVQQVANNTAANLAVSATIASGTVTTVSTVTAVTGITNALPAGTNSIGLVGTTGSTGVANAPVQNIYSTTSITTSAYTQLIASTTAATNYVDIFDSSGQSMILSTGASGSEVILAYIPPGGAQIRVKIPAATRIAYKALSANATTGYLLLNMWQ